MRKEHWLVLSLWVGLVFNLCPDGKDFMEPDPFPFFDPDDPDWGIRLQTFVFMICEKVSTLILIGVIAWSDRRKIVLTFFALQVLDLVDYLMCYNTVWKYIGVPFSFNVLNVGIMTVYLIINHVWNRSNS